MLQHATVCFKVKRQSHFYRLITNYISLPNCVLGILTTVSLVPTLSVSMRELELCFLVLGASGGTSLDVDRASSVTFELEPAVLNFFRLPVAREPLEEEQCGGRRGTFSWRSLVEPEGLCAQTLPLASEGAVSGQPPIWIHSWILLGNRGNCLTHRELALGRCSGKWGSRFKIETLLCSYSYFSRLYFSRFRRLLQLHFRREEELSAIVFGGVA